MYLLDTDTLIFILKGKENVLSHLRRHGDDELIIPIIALMELYYGACKSSDQDKNFLLIESIQNQFPILPLDASLAPLFGNIKSTLEKKGKRLADMDLMIATLALKNNLTLVSHNQKHFSRIEGLKLEDWACGEAAPPTND